MINTALALVPADAAVAVAGVVVAAGVTCRTVGEGGTTKRNDRQQNGYKTKVSKLIIFQQ